MDDQEKSALLKKIAELEEKYKILEARFKENQFPQTHDLLQNTENKDTSTTNSTNSGESFTSENQQLISNKKPENEKHLLKEYESSSKEEYMPIPGPLHTKIVEIFDNSEESFVTKKSKNEDFLQEERHSSNKEEIVTDAEPSNLKIVATSDNSERSILTKNQKEKSVEKIQLSTSFGNAQNTHTKMIDGDQMALRFATYNKRKGTGDHGNKYEYLMCAYYALKFCLNDKVLDFKMSTNNELFGDFDDIELNVTFSDKSCHTFLIQLKHSQEKRGVTEKMLGTEKDNFSLYKYFKSFTTIESRENMTFILLTNRKSQLKHDSNFLLTHGDIKGEITVKAYQPKKHLLVNTAEENTDSCFQFELDPNQDNSTNATEFFQNFYLLTNQLDVARCQLFIEKMLKNLFGCNIDFVSFMQHWWTNSFVLTRHDVIAKLVELALTPYIQEIPFKSHNCISEKSKILKNAIEKFDMTLLTECDNQKVKQMWTDSLYDVETKIISKASLKYGVSTTRIKSKDEISPSDQSKVLWYLNKVPLIVKFEEDAKVRIRGAVKLLETEEKKMKIILLGNQSREEFNTWNIFENLYDLKQCEKSYEYKQIIESFRVSLQGRTSITLKQLIEIDVEITKLIKSKDLFEMLEEDLRIGKSLADLPEAYIPRIISTLFLETQQVLDYYISSESTLLIFICNNEMKNVIISTISSNSRWHNIVLNKTNNMSKSDFSTSSILSRNRDKGRNRKILEIEEFGDRILQKPLCTAEDSKTILFSTNENFTTKEFEKLCESNSQINIYLLQIIDEERCALVSSRGNINQFNRMKSSDEEIKENEVFSIFKNSLNVVIGKPGIGKSILFTFLSKQCPSDWWCIRINLIEFNSVFKEKLDHNVVLDKILKKDEEVCDKILDKFKTSNKICLFIDGLDEIGSECIKDVLEFIKYISDSGFKVWVSSRENLKEKIILQLNVVPIEIQELTEKEQRTYITNRLLSDTTLENKYSTNEVENIISEIFKSVNIDYNAKRLLGIPLQLYIITETFRGKRQKMEFTEEYFVLSKMYRRFFYGKYEQQKAKAGINYEDPLDIDLDHILKQYELPALRTCLDNETFNKLQLREQELEESQTFLEKNKRLGNKLGIINHIVDEGQKLQAIFCHQSFAEYFACKWLEHNFDKLHLIKDNFFEVKYQNLRLIFDIMLAEDNQLHLATIYKNLDQVKKYNKENNDNEKDRGGRSALHIICSYSEVVSLDARNEEETLYIIDILKLLLENNYDPTEDDKLFNLNCLEYALHSKTLLPFDIILEFRKANININDLFKHFKDDELLNYCSRFGYSNLLTMIVKQSPNITHKMSGHLIWQALRKCIESKEEYFIYQYLKTIEILAKFGCNLNQMDKIEFTEKCAPIHYACRYGSYDIIEKLLEFGCDINALDYENSTVLHNASMYNNSEIVEYLIKKGMNVNQVDINNWIPLHFACEESNCDVINTLLKNGSDINAVTNDSKTVLHLASSNNKPEIIEYLIKKGLEINQVDKNNWTPLHYAYRYSNCDVINTLLKNGSDINAVTNDSRTVLHLASSNNKPEIIEYLIKKGLEINQVDIDNWTPVHYACRYSNCDVINTLLENGSDINAVTNDSATVLHLASRNNKPEIIEYLIKKGLEINQVDKNNWTPLHYACRYSNCDVINTLLENGSDINAVDNDSATVLHMASCNNKPEIIEYLIKKGLGINQVDIDNWTPVHYACRYSNCDVINTLLENGSDINAVDNDGWTVLHMASRNNKPEIIEYLIKLGLEINQVDKNKWTPLHYACRYSNCDVINTLLENGSDINAVDNDGWTVLHMASRNNKPEIIEYLIKKGMNVNQVDINNWIPLHFACEESNCDVINTLLKNGSDINAVTNDSRTVLHLASSNNKPEIIEYLIKQGREINQVDKNNWTPLHYACRYSNCDVINTLLENGSDINAVTNNNATVLDLALMNENKDVFLHLKKFLSNLE